MRLRKYSCCIDVIYILVGLSRLPAWTLFEPVTSLAMLLGGVVKNKLTRTPNQTRLLAVFLRQILNGLSKTGGKAVNCS